MPTAGSTPCGRTSTPRRSGNDLRLRTTERTKLRRRASVLIDRGNEVGVVVASRKRKRNVSETSAFSHACLRVERFRLDYPTTPGFRSSHRAARARRWRPSRGPRAFALPSNSSETRPPRARASRSRVGGEGDARRRAADDGVDDATSTARRGATRARRSRSRRPRPSPGPRARTLPRSAARTTGTPRRTTTWTAAPSPRTRSVWTRPGALCSRTPARDVLELGVGTGLNLPGYDATRVASLTAVDISRGMLEKAEARARGRRACSWTAWKSAATSPSPTPSACRFRTRGRLRLRGGHTFSLCVFADPEAALREVRRVLKPTVWRCSSSTPSPKQCLCWARTRTSSPRR